MNIYSIYRITNNINGKIYIGQSLRPEQRRSAHFSGKGSKPLWSAMLKYGSVNFTFDILYQTKHSNDVDCVEKTLIEEYKTTNKTFGYNIQNGGKSGGNVQSEQSRRKLSEFWKGKPKPPRTANHLLRIGAGNRGKKKPKSGPKGKVWYHNFEQEMFAPILSAPSGYIRGRLPKKYGRKDWVKSDPCQASLQQKQAKTENSSQIYP